MLPPPDKPGELEEKGRKRLNTEPSTHPVARPQTHATPSIAPDQASQPRLAAIQPAVWEAIPLTYFVFCFATRLARDAC